MCNLLAMALPTPYSYKQEKGDGSKVEFSFAFDFIDQAHIYVYLDKTLVSQGTGSSEWQWDSKPSDKKIKMGTAPTSAQALTIRRVTPQDKRIVQWTDGTYLLSDDLNTSDTQWQYLIQEHSDIINRILYGETPIPGPKPPPPYSFWNKYARHDDPNKGKTDESAQTIDSTDQLAGDASSPQNGIDAYVMTLGAISSRLDVIVGSGSSYPGSGNVGQQGKLRIDNSSTPNKLYYWNTSSTAWVEIKGTDGKAATVDVGTTSTLDAGKDATVTNSGTTSAAKFDFGIPKGEKGDPGDGVNYKGGIDPTASDPATPSNGDFYVSTAAGTARSAWKGLTTVAVNDRLIWNNADDQWDRYSQSWIQSDWAESTSTAAAFIKNKPNLKGMALVDDAPKDGDTYGRKDNAWAKITAGATNLGYTAATDQGTVTSSTGTDATVPLADATNAGLFTAAEKTKLSGIATGAEVNVQSDWDATSGDAQILNKPALNFVPLAGGTMTGNLQMSTASVIGDNTRAVPTGGNWDIQDSSVWQVANNRTITFPDDSAAPIAGQTGIFNCVGTVAGWTNANGGAWVHPGGTAQAGNANGAVIPFYVESATRIRLGAQTAGAAGTAGTGTVTATSSSFTSGNAIPVDHVYNQGTCSESNNSVQLSWSASGLDTGRSVSTWEVRCVDTSANNFVHWNVTGIPSGTTSIAENGTWPAGTTINNTDYGTAPGDMRANGWAGPCPPSGDGAHTYSLTVTAVLDNGSRVTSTALTFTRETP